MAEFPALPLWTDAYFADTRHLSTLEHGAYLLLLMEAWRRQTCSLPNDDRLLARLAGLTAEQWVDVKPMILPFFDLDKRSNELHQKRLRKERDFLREKSRKQSERAASGWNKRKKKDAAAMPEACRSDAPTPTPTPTKTEVDKSTSVSRAGVRSAFADFWDAYPRRVGKKAAEAKFEQAVKSGVPPSRIIAAARAYAEHPDAVRDGGRFLKHPTTWLNQGCWDDELPAPQPRQLHCISGGQDGRAQYTPGEQRMLRDREIRLAAAREAARMLAAEQAEEG
jgi:uncharacterized protein YdaU (DUF1376 family)